MLSFPLAYLDLLKHVCAESATTSDIAKLGDADFSQGLLEFLLHNKLAGYFYITIREQSLDTNLDAETRDLLDQAYQRQVALNREYLVLLSELQTQLREQEAHLTLLKGLALAELFSGGWDRRFMWDVDVLVHRQAVTKAIEVAAGLGLSSKVPGLSPMLVDLLNMHALEVSHRGRAIDIHWYLRNRPGYRIDYARLHASVQPVELDGQQFLTLSDPDALAFALLEMAEDLERSHFKLRTVWDIYLMLRKLDQATDWEAFFALRKEEGLLRLSVNTLSICLLLLDCESEFSALHTALQAYHELILVTDRETVVEMVSRPRQSLKNRHWYARLQPRPQWLYWAWLGSTAPLRLLVMRKL